MSNNLSEGPVQIFDTTVAAINLALRDIQARMDAIKGLQGRVMVYDRIRADAAEEADDVVTLGSMTTLENQPFVTVSSSTVLTAERVLTGEATVITITDAGANSTVTVSITANGVTFAKIQQVSTDRLVGRDTAGTGNLEQLTVTGGVEFTGAGGIQRSALTGDVTASAGSNATTIANNAVSDAKLRDSAAVSVIGRSTNSSGDPADIAASANGQVLRRTSDVVGFGAIDLADGTNAVSGVLATANGGTGMATSHGTYTPTLTGVANVAASTAYAAQWLRIGNTVLVSGRVDVDPTLTATSTQLGISLPVASNLAAANECAGSAGCPTIAGQSAAILGDAANNRAQMEWLAGDITNQPMYFVFSYLVT